MIDNVSYVDNQFSPLPIETDTAMLRREAEQAQRQWFVEPHSTCAKARFAEALKRWAIAAGDKTALDQAIRLLGEL
jgi:hypothetical protein